MKLSSPTKAKPSYASCRRDESGGIPRASESRSNAVGYGARGMGILGVRSEGEESRKRRDLQIDRQTDSACRVGTRERAPAVIERIRRNDGSGAPP